MTAIRSGTQSFLILAQDPGMRGQHGERLFTSIQIPAERIWRGPTGYRVRVVDFDSETGALYRPHDYSEDAHGCVVDPFATRLPPPDSPDRARAEEQLLADPAWHAQNAYALVMRTLARFEYALGRRVRWGFDSHQLHVAPHAFVDANAFYSREDRALMFGYFAKESTAARRGARSKARDAADAGDGFVFTCLSHDIVVHETTHALLDGLREGFMNHSGPDQAAFHEGFSDVVALLSIFSLKGIVELALTHARRPRSPAVVKREGRLLIHRDALTASNLADSALLGLAEEFGRSLGNLRANALRRSVRIKPSRDLLDDPEYAEPHTRGEVLVAAVMRTLLHIWVGRIGELGQFGGGYCNLSEVAAEGAKVADHLLTMSIRALDYCPPLDLEFGDYLAALLTVDAQVAPDDRRYRYRDTVLEVFRSYGIDPPAERTDASGCWRAFQAARPVQYRRTNFESMLRDPEEVFRFVWENREVLEVDERSHTQVISVRPVVRIGPEGFLLRETICEYISRANIFGAELESVCKVAPRPEGIRSNTPLTVYGAGTLVFDQYGQLKYHIARRMSDARWQRRRLEYLFGTPPDDAEGGNPFARLHRLRAYCASCDSRNSHDAQSSKAASRGPARATQPRRPRTAAPPATARRGGAA
jgi:hypothetical protein